MNYRHRLLWLALLVFQTLAFLQERNSCRIRIHRRRSTDNKRSSSIPNTPIDVSFGEQENHHGEEIQDAYGRTIRRVDDSQSDPLTDTFISSDNTTDNTTDNNNNNNNNMNLEPLVVCGPSGVGKGTVIESLRKRFPPELFGFSVSHTTRDPRPGEIHGQHYFFTTIPEIQSAISQGRFVEHAAVHGNYYGTSHDAIALLQKQGTIAILDIDVQGVQSVKESQIPAKFIFIAPPCMDELEARLRGRGTETEAAISKRLGNAASEIQYGTTKGNFDKVFVNHDVQATVDEMVQVLEEWYPQLKNHSVSSKTEPDLTWDFLAESDKMMRFPSVRKGHGQLQVRDQSEQIFQDLGPIHTRARVNGNHHGYYTVDLEEPEGPRSYPKLGTTNLNIVLDSQGNDTTKSRRAGKQPQDLGEVRNRENVNGNHHGYYTVDLEEPDGPRSYPKLGKVNPNFRMELQCDDEEKAY